MVKADTPPPPTPVTSLTPIQTPTSTGHASPMAKKHQMVTQVLFKILILSEILYFAKLAPSTNADSAPMVSYGGQRNFVASANAALQRLHNTDGTASAPTSGRSIE